MTHHFGYCWHVDGNFDRRLAFPFNCGMWPAVKLFYEIWAISVAIAKGCATGCPKNYVPKFDIEFIFDGSEWMICIYRELLCLVRIFGEIGFESCLFIFIRFSSQFEFCIIRRWSWNCRHTHTIFFALSLSPFISTAQSFRMSVTYISHVRRHILSIERNVDTKLPLKSQVFC